MHRGMDVSTEFRRNGTIVTPYRDGWGTKSIDGVGLNIATVHGFEEVDQYFLVDFFEAACRALGNPTPSRGCVPCLAWCGVIIVPALRASVAETAQRYSCDHALDLWDSGPHHFATSPKRSFWMAWLVRNEELGIRSSIVSNLFAATQKRSFWMVIMV